MFPTAAFLILRTNQRDIIINANRSSCQVRVIVNILQSNTHFHGRFSINPQISNFMKILPVIAKLYHVDGQIDTRKRSDGQTWWR